VQEDALHVLVVVGMAVPVVVVAVIVRVSMSMMCVAKSSETHDVDEEAENTDDQEFVQSVQLVAFPQTLECVKDDLYTDKPETY
jgi:hypothetical protein